MFHITPQLESWALYYTKHIGRITIHRNRPGNLGISVLAMFLEGESVFWQRSCPVGLEFRRIRFFQEGNPQNLDANGDDARRPRNAQRHEAKPAINPPAIGPRAGPNGDKNSF